MPLAEVLWYDLATVRRYEGLLEEACMEADVPFLPLIEPLLGDPCWRDWLLLDGVHLNGEGHRRVFQRLRTWPALLAWAGLRLEALATPMGWS
jgi:lysophospholipase L1-like esterase